MTHPPSKRELLFCPFCREAFVGETTCPSDELNLVRWEELPETAEATSSPEATLGATRESPVPLMSPALGRGWVAIGAIVALAGWMLPFAARVGGREVSASGMQLAMTQAPNLWSTALAAMAVLAIVARRRTAAALQAARVVVPVLAVMMLAAAGYSAWRILLGAQAQSVAVRFEVGAYAVALGGVLTAIAGVRLGRQPAKTRRRVRNVGGHEA